MNYQGHAPAGTTDVDLIVSLYDGWIRYLYRAVNAVDSDDVIERRHAVKRALEILVYLEARPRPDAGGAPERTLSDFYEAMFTMTLEASHAGSRENLLAVIACVRDVRRAWVEATHDPQTNRALPRELRRAAERRPGYSARPLPISMLEALPVTRWTT